jgi:hypothetical protein
MILDWIKYRARELKKMTTQDYPLKLKDKERGKPLGLPQVTPEMLTKVPEELHQAWADYMTNGFKNNEKMFQSTLNAFMKPYNITILMYVVIFIVGILFFVIAVVFGFRGDPPILAVGFGGLSIISFITFFIRQPVQALEENLECISWLGVAFNTYWTSLMYITDKDKVQDELKAATDDFVNHVEKLIDKHAKLRSDRAGSSPLTETKPKADKEDGS